MAIYAEDDCKAAWLTKVSALHAVSRHDEALADMTALKTMYEGDEVVKHWHEQADFKARKAKRSSLKGSKGGKRPTEDEELTASRKK